MSTNSLMREEDKRDKNGTVIQCLPLYSILLALGNPTVNYFRQRQKLTSIFLQGVGNSLFHLFCSLVAL